MKPADRLRIQQSETRERINELLAEDATDESRAEMRELTTRAQNIEVELRAAIVAEPDAEVRTVPMDSEHRERLQLRQAASLTNYLTAALQGRMPSGAELELRQDPTPAYLLSCLTWKCGPMRRACRSTWTPCGR